MADQAARLEVGRIARAHGLRGEVVIAPVSNVAARFAAGATVYAGDRPLHISTSRAQSGRFVVRLEGVDDRSAAEALRGTLLTGDPLGRAPEGEVWVHEMIGAHVTDTRGRDLGRVRHVEANPAHDVLVCDSGVLVPVVFIIEHEPGRILVEVPDGLVELYLADEPGAGD